MVLYLQRLVFRYYNINLFQLSHCYTCHSCNLINLYLFISTSRKWIFLVCCNAWSERSFLTYFIMASVQHFSNVTWPNIIVNMVSSNITAYCTGFCFRCHCICRMQWFLKKSCKMVIKKCSHIIIMCRYCCCVKNWCFTEIGPHILYLLHHS